MKRHTEFMQFGLLLTPHRNTVIVPKKGPFTLLLKKENKHPLKKLSIPFYFALFYLEIVMEN